MVKRERNVCVCDVISCTHIPRSHSWNDVKQQKRKDGRPLTSCYTWIQANESQSESEMNTTFDTFLKNKRMQILRTALSTQPQAMTLMMLLGNEWTNSKWPETHSIGICCSLVVSKMLWFSRYHLQQHIFLDSAPPNHDSHTHIRCAPNYRTLFVCPSKGNRKVIIMRIMIPDVSLFFFTPFFLINLRRGGEQQHFIRYVIRISECFTGIQSHDKITHTNINTEPKKSSSRWKKVRNESGMNVKQQQRESKKKSFPHVTVKSDRRESYEQMMMKDLHHLKERGLEWMPSFLSFCVSC